MCSYITTQIFLKKFFRNCPNQPLEYRSFISSLFKRIFDVENFPHGIFLKNNIGTKYDNMKAPIIMILFITLTITGINAQNIFSTGIGHVSFFSKAPISDVDAVNDKVNVELNTSTQEFTCDIAMKEFKFKSGKMGRDARKKYIEIDAYPNASFKGKITGKIDYEKPGSYPATSTGKLTIHGVEKQVSENGTVIVQDGKLRLESQFNVRLKDYNINTPKILGQKMTQDDVLVKINATLTKQDKKPTRK